METPATPDQGSTPNPNQGTADANAGTGQDGATPDGQGGTSEEVSFIPQGVDRAALHPAIRAEVERIEKEMVRGFKAKTTEIAQYKKDAETWKKSAEEFSKYKPVLEDQEFVQKWNAHVNERAANGQTTNLPPEVEKRLAAIEQREQASKVHDSLNSFADEMDKDGNRLRPEMDILESVKVGDKYNLFGLLAVQAPGDTVEAKFQWAYEQGKTLIDKLRDEGRKEAVERVQAKVRGRAEPPSSAVSGKVYSGDPKKLSTREAFELAEKGIRVS